MLSKLSVKKPMTVFVAVVLIIVLGVVSFLRMTPDLLPNMDLPYAVILTAYIGQTPETVETTVTKPLEQQLSTIDGVKQITSNSAENYSLLMVEFEDGTNMDSATVDARSAIDMVSDSWPDMVGSPYLIKINPSILPVAMTAVDYGDRDRAEISDFVSNELMNKLEGIDGVASVNEKGILTERENILISQKKLDRLNKKISNALEEKFADAQDKLDDARAQLEKNMEDAKSGGAAVSSAIDEINSQQEALSEQLESAQNEADNGKSQLISAKMELLDQKSSLTQTRTLLDAAYQGLLSIKETAEELTAKKIELSKRLGELEIINNSYKAIREALDNASLGDEEREELNKQLAELNKSLEPYGITADGLGDAIDSAQKAIASVDSALDNLEKNLTERGAAMETLDSSVGELKAQLDKIDDGISQIDSAISGLDDKSVTVNEALSTIAAQRAGADFKMSSALSQLTSQQSQLNAAQAQLESAQTELDKSLDELDSQKKAAEEKADIRGSVTLDNVAAILTAQSFSMPAGYVTDDGGSSRYLVRVGDEVKDETALSELVLFDTGIEEIGVVRLRDVADVFTSDNSDELYAKINGKDGVILSFSKASNIATSTVCSNINSEFKTLEEKYPGLSFTNLYSQGDYIGIIVNGVLQNLLMGAALAIIILFLFLRDIKPTVIVACSIPVSVIFAIVLMYFSGVTLNMISLSGLAIGVGMLVDNSVVVIENIYRLRALGNSAASAAVNGAKQVAGAIIASTLTTICVFFPIVFVEGLTRQIFVDMALTIAYSLLASLVVALTLVPAMSSRMLGKIKNPNAAKEGKILGFYEKSIRFVLRHKVISIIVVIALLVGSTLGALTRGFSFMPSMSGTELEVDLALDENATFEETVEAAEKIREVMDAHGEFETVGVTVGKSTSLMGIVPGGVASDAGNVMAYGVLADGYSKKGAEISKTLESELENIPGTLTVGEGSTGSYSTILGDGTVQIILYGEELETLRETADDMAEKLASLDSIDTSDSGKGATSPEIKITVNKLKAAENYLTVAQVFQQVASAVADEKTSTTLKTEDGKNIDIVVIKDSSGKVYSDSLGDIELTGTDREGAENKVKLSKIADITKGETMDVISRTDQRRNLVISGTVAEGHTLTEASNDAERLFSDYELPSGISIEYSGTNQQTMEAVQQLMLMLLLGIILIYLIMVAQFQSLKSPFIIMFTIPLAFTGGFIGLLVTGFDISIVSMVGFIMLCGIIVNNGIVLVDYINKLRLEGMDRVEAIVQAGKTRMRPIFITALTTVLGLSVMALGIGTGAEMMQPLAIVCIGGLLYATLMTLYIIPLIYDAFNRRAMKKLSDSDLELEIEGGEAY